MFFKLCNSPATFQAYINHFFKDLIDKGWIIIYIDDILILTKDKGKQEHDQQVEEVLWRLQQHNLFLKLKKCEFKKKSLEYLGLIISYNSIAIDAIKLIKVIEWPKSVKVKDIQAFLGFANFYWNFIKDFFTIC